MPARTLLVAAMLYLLPIFGVTGACAEPVQVAYAGSLVATMEGPLRAALYRDTGLQFAGEAKGSRALANLIAAGLRFPDVFISADAALLKRLQRMHLLRGYVVFGSARMVIAYSDKSPHRALLQQAAAGKASLLQVLAEPALRVGSTDPQLDPKGARTLRAIELLGRHFHDMAKARTIAAKVETFPEEDLAVRVESGELDAGFFYSTETPGRQLRTIELPADANLSNDIAYAMAVMRNAPHPSAARRFALFLLEGAGKTVLQRAGVRYFTSPRVNGLL